MEDHSEKLNVLSHLYAQLGPLIQKVNSINQELQQLKRGLSGTLPADAAGFKRSPRTLYEGLGPPAKRRRMSSNCDLLMLPDQVLWQILRKLDTKSLVHFSMTCKLARFFANENLLWFPFQHRTFGKLECKQLQISVGEEIISHIGARLHIRNNWENGVYTSNQTSIQQQQYTIRIDPIQNNVIVSASKTELTEWDFNTGKQLITIQQHPGTTYNDFCIDSDKIYTSSSDYIRAYGRIDKTLQYEIKDLLSSPYRLAISPKYLVTGLWNGSINIYNPFDGNLLRTLTGHKYPIHCMDIKRNVVATGSSDRSIKLWNVGGDLLHAFPAHPRTVSSIHLSKDVSQLFSASKDNIVRLWDVKEAKLISEFYGHTESVNSVIWRGETIFTSCSDDKNIIIWDTRQASPAHTLVAHNAPVICMDIDERKIASCSSDKVLITWDFARLDIVQPVIP